MPKNELLLAIVALSLRGRKLGLAGGAYLLGVEREKGTGVVCTPIVSLGEVRPALRVS